MLAADLDAVLRIERGAFVTPWQRSHFLTELADHPYADNRVLEVDGRVVAYVCCWRVHDELRVNNVAVDAAHRRQGIARRILATMMDHAARAGCRRATLEVRPSNRPALALYGDLGFVEVGRRPGYYRAEKEDALLMDAPLRRLPEC